MSGRDIIEHALTFVTLIAAVYIGYESIVTTVTVPVILPVLSTAGCIASLVTTVRRWRAEERQRAARIAAAEQPTVHDIITRYRSGPRIGDRERDIVVQALNAHFTAGRLDQAELGERLAVAVGAKTLDDLADAVDGLPSEVDGR